MGLSTGSVLEWSADGDTVTVRRVGKYTFHDIHKMLFPNGPPPRRAPVLVSWAIFVREAGEEERDLPVGPREVDVGREPEELAEVLHGLVALADELLVLAPEPLRQRAPRPLHPVALAAHASRLSLAASSKSPI